MPSKGPAPWETSQDWRTPTATRRASVCAISCPMTRDVIGPVAQAMCLIETQEPAGSGSKQDRVRGVGACHFAMAIGLESLQFLVQQKRQSNSVIALKPVSGHNTSTTTTTTARTTRWMFPWNKDLLLFSRSEWDRKSH